jgi:ABC-type transporter Mla subunit MlaD
MTRTFAHLAVSAWILGAIAAGSPAAQEKADAPDVPALLKELREAQADRKGAKDTQARQVIDQLTAAYEKMDGKQKKDTTKGLKNVFNIKRTPETAELLVAATEALSRMGADGARALEDVIENRTYKDKDWQTLRAQAVEALGKTADKDAVKSLLDLFNDKFDKILAATGKALGNYGGASEQVRKQIVEEMVKRFNSIYNGSKASVDPNDMQQQTFVERYNAIQDPWNNTLAELTGQSFREPPQWQAWWNDNKKKKWQDRPKPQDAKGTKPAGGDDGK